MSLRDRLAAAEPNRRVKCFVCLLLADLSKDDRLALEEAINGNLQASVICRVLQSEGYSISPVSLRRHRRKECAHDD